MRGRTMRTAVIAILAAIAIIITVGGIAFAIDKAGGTKAPDGTTVHYFNNDVNSDDIEGNNFNFGPDAYAEGEKEVADGKVASVKDYGFRIDEDGKPAGNLLDRMALDPALTGAIATEILKRDSIDPTMVLGDRADEFKDVKVARLPDKLHLAFLKDPDFWGATVTRIGDILAACDYKVEMLTNYKSAMYQFHNGLENNKPAVIVRQSINSGGHVMIFDGGKAGIFKFRMECGYQPVDVDEYWPTPDEPGIPDNPTPPDEPDPPGGSDNPGVDPKKDDGGPQGQMGNNASPNYGGGQNQNPDTTLTEEPQSPSTYTPPAAPTGSNDGADNDEPSYTGSPTVDHDNGTHETHGGQDYEVVAGDGQNHTDLGQIQAEANHDTVETPLQNDSGGNGGANDAPVANEGDILPPE